MTALSPAVDYARCCKDVIALIIVIMAPVYLAAEAERE